MMRKFSLKKFYNLTKWTVILISCLSLVFAYLSYRQIQYYSDQYLIDSNICHQENPRPKEINSNSNSQEINDFKAYSNAIAYCIFQGPPTTDLIMQESDNTSFVRSIAIGVLLPILFFAGGAIFRYLFPVSAEKN